MDVELTEEEFQTVAMAVENSLLSAERLQASAEAAGDLDEQLDAGYLIQRYRELQKKFPPPTISLKDME